MLEYSSVRLEDAEKITALYEEYLNSGESIGPWIRAGLEGPDYCGMKCMNGDQMVGVITARPGVEFTCGREDLVKGIEEKYQGLRIFTGDMITILDSHRGHGIARKIAEGLRDQLIEKGCDKMIIEAWHHPDTGDMPVKLITKYITDDMETFGSYPDFYHNIAAHGLTCPSCGAACQCGADVLVLDIKKP